jgi:SAM-dependent methyltransferase
MDPIQSQKEYYDQRWQREPFANSLQAARCAAIVEALSRLAVKEPRILDLGCGTGWLSAILGQFGPTTAVDLSDYAVQQASERYPWVRFFQANILEWTEASKLGPFDVVVSQEVIEHIDDQPAYLRIAQGCLRDRGILLLTTPNARTFAAMPDELGRSWSDQPFEELLTVSDVGRLVERWFDILQITTIIPGHGVKGLYRIASSYKLGRLLEALRLRHAFDAACLQAGYGLHTFVVARKRP